MAPQNSWFNMCPVEIKWNEMAHTRWPSSVQDTRETLGKWKIESFLGGALSLIPKHKVTD